MFPHDPSAPIRSCSPDPIFCRLLLPRQNFFPGSHSVISYPHAARAPADAEIFLLIRLSHKDGIKKVENTSALAFPLQASGTIRRQRQSGVRVNMQLIEVDIRFLRHELHFFSGRYISATSVTNICASMRSH